MSAERKRGPLERELYEKLRMAGLSHPVVLNASASGREPTTKEYIQVLLKGQMDHMEQILRLARELDERTR